MKGTELERSQQIHHLKKTAVFMDFAISEASGETACWELPDQIEIPEVAEAGLLFSWDPAAELG